MNRNSVRVAAKGCVSERQTEASPQCRSGWGLGMVVGLWVACMAPTLRAASSSGFEVGSLRQDLQLRLSSPVARVSAAGFLVERRGPGGDAVARRVVDWVPSIGPDGRVLEGRADMLVRVPGAAAGGEVRRFDLPTSEATTRATAERVFRFEAIDERSLELREGDRPVFVYRHGTMLKPGVPDDRARSSYVHPLYGLEGEVLTDDFPKDHYHHRGLFWSWPHVGIGGKEYDLWALKGIAHRFERWLAREPGSGAAVLGVENGWYVGEKRVVLERIWITTFAATAEARVIDLDCYWIPEGQAVSLAGAEGKSYGGMTIRYAPGTNTVITTPQGNGTNDLYMTALPWADLSRRFDGRAVSSGAALFVGPDHPDYPPTWLTRHYGVLCLGWPGVKAQTFPPGQPIRCRYRVWVHRGVPSQALVAEAYEAYAKGLQVRWREADGGR